MYSLPFFGIIGGVSLGVIESYITSLNTNLWLDGADPTKVGICQADTTFVCQWTDKSGKGNHATQSNNNSQPNYIDNRVSFTSTRFLSITNRQIFAGAISGSVFIVGRQPTTTAGAWGRFSGNTTNQTNTPDSTGNTFREGFLSPSSVATLTPSGRTPTIPLPWSILNFAHSGNQLTFRENGALDLPAGSSSSDAFPFGIPSAVATTQRLGGVTGDFDIYEVLMFPSVLSTGDRQIIEGYLAHKWGLTNLLPANHPYKTSLQGAFNTSFFSVRANEPFLPVSLPIISFANSSAANTENAGSIGFVVNRTGNLANTSSVSWVVTGSGANPANAADFVGGVFPSGTLNFAAGIASGLITVPIQDDNVVEPDEQFTITLFNPIDAVIGVATATGTIQNDDQSDTGVTDDVVIGGIDFVRGFTIDNSNNLYVAAGFAGLKIFDITNPTNPTLTGSYQTFGQAYDVQVVGNYIYVANASSGLQIINITTPFSLTLAGTYGLSSARGVQVVGNYAYVADARAGSGLQIINITNPANPTLTGSYNTPGTAEGVQVVGNYAYVADLGVNIGSGLQIIDITNPSSPTLAGTYVVNNAYDVQVVGNYAYVASLVGGLRIIDITIPNSPTLASTYTATSARQLQVVGDYVYAPNGNSGLQIINISNPTNPTLDRTYAIPGRFAYSVQVVGDYAYVGTTTGITIIDLTVNPNP